MHSGSAKAAVWSGVLATFVSAVAGYWFPALGLPQLDLIALNGGAVVPEQASLALLWTVGALQLFGGGVVMAILYGFWVQMHLPGPGWMRGLIWGGVLATVVGLGVVPLVYDGGPFGSDWGPRTVIALIAWHLLWGCVLGIAHHKQWDAPTP
jgi:hypothetical protein